jgi:hypothetical protein
MHIKQAVLVKIKPIAAQDEVCTVVFYLLHAFMWWLSIMTKW